MRGVMNETLNTPLLDTVPTPDELRQLKPEQLRQLSDELRAEMIDAVSVSGGHLGSGLGVVELTVAIHYVFNTPDDRLIWDVGHQCYPHKILTGRRDRIRTIRQGTIRLARRIHRLRFRQRWALRSQTSSMISPDAVSR